MVGEARAHVQGESLKARAALLVRLLNSPITRIGGADAFFPNHVYRIGRTMVAQLAAGGGSILLVLLRCVGNLLPVCQFLRDAVAPSRAESVDTSVIRGATIGGATKLGIWPPDRDYRGLWRRPKVF